MKIIIASVCLFTSLNILADEDIERIEVVEKAEKVPLLTQVISAEQLIDQATLLSDILATLPGVQIRRSGGIGGNVTISVRGSNSKQINVYIDGQLINNGQSGTFDLDQIPLALIESIELSPSQSTGAGMTPIGGEIRIRTRREQGQHTSGSIALGSFGYIDANLKQAIEYEEHQITANVNWLSSQNDYSYQVPQSFTNSQVSAREALNNNDFSKVSVFVNDIWQQAQRRSDVTFQFSQQTKQLPNYQNNSPENNSQLEQSNWRLNWQQDASFETQFSERWQWQMSWSEQLETYLDWPNTIKKDEYEYHNEHQSIAANWPLTIGQWQVQPYFKIEHQRFTSFSLVNQQQVDCNGIGRCDVEATQFQRHLGTSVAWQSQNTPWQVNWSWAQVNEDSKNKLRHQPFMSAKSTNESFYSQQLNISGKVAEQLLTFQYAKGVRIPTMFERFGDRGLFKGNDSLAPEQSHTLSLTSQHKWQFELLGKVKLEPSMFKQQVDNAIVAIFNSSGIGTYDNVAKVDLLGWSVNLSQSKKQWSTGLILDWLDSQTHSQFHAFDNKKQPGIYHQQLRLFAQWQFSPAWSTRIDWHRDQELYFDRANKVSSNNGLTSNRMLADWSLSYEASAFSARLHINNIFNQHYLDLANRQAVGREIRISLTIKEF